MRRTWIVGAVAALCLAACSKSESKSEPKAKEAAGAPSVGAAPGDRGVEGKGAAPGGPGGISPAGASGASGSAPAATDGPATAPAASDDPAGDPAIAADPGGGIPADGEVAVAVGRTFRAGEDNSGAEPAMFALNGDFLMWSDRCGLYADTATSALYVVCDGDVKSSPLRTEEDVTEVMRLVMEQQAAGHDATMDIINRFPTGKGPKRDRFDENGRYQGTY